MAYFNVALPLAAVGVFFAALPDIDYPKSWPGRLFPLSNRLNGKVGHRTATHSLLALGLSYIVGPAAFLGLASHILLDLLTPSGVQLAWPHNTSYVILGGPVRTGSKTEKGICIVLLAAVAVLGLSAVTQRPITAIFWEVLQWLS